MSLATKSRMICWLLSAGMLMQFGSCATTNQLKDFVRTEIALISTQVLTEPFNEAFAGLTDPQVVEEVVPSI